MKQNYIINYIYIFNYPFPSLISFNNNQGCFKADIIRLLSLNGKVLQCGILSRFNHPRYIELYGKGDNCRSKIIF